MAEENEQEKLSFTELQLEAPPPEEGVPPEAGKPGPELNRAIAELAAGLGSAFAGPKPSTPEEFHQRYVDTVTPILDFLRFHEALGALGGVETLPPMARIILGFLVLAGFFIAYHPTLRARLIKPRPRPMEKREAAGLVTPPPTPRPEEAAVPTPPPSVIEKSIEEGARLGEQTIGPEPELS